MRNYSNIFQHQVAQTIQEIEQKNLDQETQLKTICLALEQHIVEMNDWLTGYTFSNEEEEIYFFKYIRPDMIANLFYYKTRLLWESKTPIKIGDQKQFYLKKHTKIESKLKRLTYINQYYKMNSSFNDSMYFVRHHNLSAMALYTREYINYDSRLCTPQCLAVSKLLSYKMLITYLKSKFKTGNKEALDTFPKLTWSSSKQNMYEIIYALHCSEAIGEGKTSLSKIAQAFERIFDVALQEHVYKRWVNQKRRKKESTSFLRKLTVALENKIESSKND